MRVTLSGVLKLRTPLCCRSGTNKGGLMKLQNDWTWFLNVSEHSQIVTTIFKKNNWQWTACKGGTLYVLNEQRFLRKLRFERSMYSTKFSEMQRGTLYVLNKNRIKISGMQRGDPLHFEQSLFSAKFSEMQRGDPLRFSQIPYKSRRNAKGGPFTKIIFFTVS